MDRGRGRILHLIALEGEGPPWPSESMSLNLDIYLQVVDYYYPVRITN